MTTPIILNVVICHYQTFVACTTVNKAFYSMFTEFYIQSPDSYLVQVAVKNMLVLRWNQRAHYWFLGRPKGHSALWKRPSKTLLYMRLLIIKNAGKSLSWRGMHHQHMMSHLSRLARHTATLYCLPSLNSCWPLLSVDTRLWLSKINWKIKLWGCQNNLHTVYSLVCVHNCSMLMPQLPLSNVSWKHLHSCMVCCIGWSLHHSSRVKIMQIVLI